MSGGVIRLPGGNVVVSGDAVRCVATALELVAAHHRRNGCGLSGLLAELYEEFAAAATEARTSDAGSAEVPPGLDLSSSAMADPITVTEAAALTGTTPRNWRDLCRRGSLETARRLGSHWLIERHEVLARRERKAS